MTKSNNMVYKDKNLFYQTLTERNKHFISKETQDKLSKLKILIAGCGTAGGACPETLARLGVQTFLLTDNGDYELNNLNRQHAHITDIDKNKASCFANMLIKINPFIELQTCTEGVNAENVEMLVSSADLIIDAVDVTSQSAIDAKISLHEHAKKYRKPVLCPIDPGFCSCGLGFDYRNPSVKVLNGNLQAAKTAPNTFVALLSILPIQLLPAHSLHLIIELLEGKTSTGSQLTISSSLLSAVIASITVKFAENGTIAKKWNINLDYLAMPFAKRMLFKAKRPFLLARIKKLVKN